VTVPVYHAEQGQCLVQAKGRAYLATYVEPEPGLRKLAFDKMPPDVRTILIDGQTYAVLERTPSPWAQGTWTMKARKTT